MTGHHKFNQLTQNISPERKTKIEQKKAKIKEKIELNQSKQAFWEK